MKIVYLIGNGFDINLGLKTRFRQFYDYYLEQNSPTEVIKKFKETLAENKDIEKWADLELALGEYAEHFSKNTALDFRELLIDIQDNLAQYINLQKTEFHLSEEDRSKINGDLFFPDEYLNEREKRDFYEYKKRYDLGNYFADIITFNYTDTFEHIYEYTNEKKQIGTHTFSNNKYANILNSVEHIHGITESNMILGINDISQLNNEELRADKRIIRCIVKPEMNRNAGTLRDYRCLRLIAEADLICIFGMSLGKTDTVWWQAINKRLLNSNNATLIVFAVNSGTPARRDFLKEDDKDKIKDTLLSYNNFSSDQKNNILNRIFVGLNTNMFGISIIRQKKGVA